MGADGHFLDIRCRFARGLHLLVQRHRRFDGGLRVEFCRERNFEQHVFHHVGAVRALETERFTFE